MKSFLRILPVSLILVLGSCGPLNEEERISQSSLATVHDYNSHVLYFSPVEDEGVFKFQVCDESIPSGVYACVDAFKTNDPAGLLLTLESIESMSGFLSDQQLQELSQYADKYRLYHLALSSRSERRLYDTTIVGGTAVLATIYGADAFSDYKKAKAKLPKAAQEELAMLGKTAAIDSKMSADQLAKNRALPQRKFNFLRHVSGMDHADEWAANIVESSVDKVTEVNKLTRKVDMMTRTIRYFPAQITLLVVAAAGVISAAVVSKLNYDKSHQKPTPLFSNYSQFKDVFLAQNSPLFSTKVVNIGQHGFSVEQILHSFGVWYGAQNTDVVITQVCLPKLNADGDAVVEVCSTLNKNM